MKPNLEDIANQEEVKRQQTVLETLSVLSFLKDTHIKIDITWIRLGADDIVNISLLEALETG